MYGQFFSKPALVPEHYQVLLEAGHLIHTSQMKEFFEPKRPKLFLEAELEILYDNEEFFMSDEPKQLDLILNNDIITNRGMVRHVLKICEDHEVNEDMLFKIHLGLEEALTNAITHGNLELESQDFRTHENYSSWEEEIKQRMESAPYCDRKVSVHIEIYESQKVIIEIADEGKGFDYQSALENNIPDDIYQPHGRGLAMMKNVAQLRFNEKGNVVTLTFNPDDSL